MHYNISQLEANLDVFKSLLNHVDKNMISWRQAPEKWCLLDIVCHLYDEERDDFRFRTQWVLEQPGETPPPFNPLDWVEERNYKEQDFNTKVNAFIKERKLSINWLKSLENPQWDNYYEHKTQGKLTASFFLTNWLAHDYLHIKQILKLKFDYLKQRYGTSLDYAGNW